MPRVTPEGYIRVHVQQSSARTGTACFLLPRRERGSSAAHTKVVGCFGLVWVFVGGDFHSFICFRLQRALLRASMACSKRSKSL